MKDKSLLILFITIFIVIRSIHFSQYLNFSFDQGWASTRVLEIWRNKEITLVGPGSSIIVHGKQILQGSITYYFLLFFLLLGKFDPIISSYLFMLFCALMSIPLYYGIKFVSNIKIACFIVLLYCLLPLYVDFTRFFFGPAFQLSLFPLVMFFIGLFYKTNKTCLIFFIFFMTGIISQFHFAFLLVTLVIFIWLFYKVRSKKLLLILSVTGFITGFFPILLFEVKNKFYNLTVFIEYLRYARNPANFALLPHRYLSLSLISLILISILCKKLITSKLITFTALILIIFDLFLYLPLPDHAFGMSPHWNFLMEKKTYEIIKSQKIKNYNIVNHIYDNLSVVIKFQMKRDDLKINYDDYYHNEYLYVISSTEHVFDDPAYELRTFQPNNKIGKWTLNKYYNLYVFKRM